MQHRGMKAERDGLGFESILELLFTGDLGVVRMLVAQKIKPTLPQLNIPQDKADEIAERIVLKVRANPQCRGVKPTRRGGIAQFWAVYGQIVRESIREYSPKWGEHKEPERELSWAELLERDEKLSDVPVFSQLGKLEEEAKEEEEEEVGDFTERIVGSTLMPPDDYKDDDDDSDERMTQKDIEDILLDRHKLKIERLSIHIERLHSDRQRDIMNCFLCGKGVKEIADSLSVSPSYVSKVIHECLKRFGYSEGRIKELKLDIKEYTRLTMKRG